MNLFSAGAIFFDLGYPQATIQPTKKECFSFARPYFVSYFDTTMLNMSKSVIVEATVQIQTHQ